MYNNTINWSNNRLTININQIDDDQYCSDSIKTITATSGYCNVFTKQQITIDQVILEIEDMNNDIKYLASKNNVGFIQLSHEQIYDIVEKELNK